MPSGGNGSYYFFTYLLVSDGQWGLFDMVLNGKTVCTAYGDQREATADNESISCSALVHVREGDKFYSLEECLQVAFLLVYLKSA